MEGIYLNQTITLFLSCVSLYFVCLVSKISFFCHTSHTIHSYQWERSIQCIPTQKKIIIVYFLFSANINHKFQLVGPFHVVVNNYKGSRLDDAWLFLVSVNSSYARMLVLYLGHEKQRRIDQTTNKHLFTYYTREFINTLISK